MSEQKNAYKQHEEVYNAVMDPLFSALIDQEVDDVCERWKCVPIIRKAINFPIW